MNASLNFWLEKICFVRVEIVFNPAFKQLKGFHLLSLPHYSEFMASMRSRIPSFRATQCYIALYIEP